MGPILRGLQYYHPMVMIRWPLFLVKLGSNSWEKKRDGFPHKRLWIISQKWGQPKETERQPECLFSFFLYSLLIALLSGKWALTNHSSCLLSFSLRFDYFDMNKPNSYLRMVTSQTLQLFCRHLTKILTLKNLSGKLKAGVDPVKSILKRKIHPQKYGGGTGNLYNISKVKCFKIAA